MTSYFHNTETALLRVTNDILRNMNNQRVTLLIQLLDLSAAFDIIDYDTLLHRLRFSFDIHEKVLSWCKSYNRIFTTGFKGFRIGVHG